MTGASTARAFETWLPRNSPAPMTRCKAHGLKHGVLRGGLGATPSRSLEAGGDCALDVFDDLRHLLPDRPPRGWIGPDERTDRHLDPAERTQHVGSQHCDGRDGNPGLQGKVADPDLQRPQPAPARIAALGKDEDDASTLQDLVDGAQAGLIELAAMWRDWKDSDERQETAFPGSVEDGFTLRHRVDHRGRRKERDDESRVEPGLVVRGDQVWRRRYVLEAVDRDPEQVQHQPPDDAPDQPVEARRMCGVRVYERVERGSDERPVLGAGVLLWRGRRGSRR